MASFLRTAREKRLLLSSSSTMSVSCTILQGASNGLKEHILAGHQVPRLE